MRLGLRLERHEDGARVVGYWPNPPEGAELDEVIEVPDTLDPSRLAGLDGRGRPVLEPAQPRPTLEEARAAKLAGLRGELERRVLQAGPLAQQLAWLADLQADAADPDRVKAEGEWAAFDGERRRLRLAYREAKGRAEKARTHAKLEAVRLEPEPPAPDPAPAEPAQLPEAPVAPATGGGTKARKQT